MNIDQTNNLWKVFEVFNVSGEEAYTVLLSSTSHLQRISENNDVSWIVSLSMILGVFSGWVVKAIAILIV